MSALGDDEGIWYSRVSVYREEPIIKQAIENSKKKGLSPDMSLIQELATCFPFLRESEEQARTIGGPADLARGLALASELQGIKDRAAEIILKYDNIRGKLERLLDTVKTNLYLRKEILSLKNDPQRNAVVSLTCPEIEDKLSAVNRVLAAAETVTKNVNQTYNILKLQVDIVKEMMYEGGLARALKGDRS